MNAAWTTTIIVAGVLVLLTVVAVDRNRLRRRLDATDGAITGLRLDLAAARDRIEQLQGYLSRPDSWDVAAAAPARLTDPAVPDRWTPDTGPSTGTTAGTRTLPSRLRDPSPQPDVAP